MSPQGASREAEPREAGDQSGQVASFDLPADGLAPAQARRSVEQLLLTRWYVRDQGFVDDVLLLTSELVTNAVRHGGSAVTLHVALGSDVIEIAVEDGSALLPTQPTALADNPYREGGRGLLIVSALASEWGIQAKPSGGKRVWARLARFTPA